MGRPRKGEATTPALKPVNLPEQESVSQQVLKAITDYIIDAKLEPGDRLPSERQLSDALGVTRPVVRTAIQTLGMLGITDVRQGDGSYLKEGGFNLASTAIEWGLFLREKRIMDLVETRRFLEVTLAGLAAQRRSDDQLIAIRGHLDRMADATITDAAFTEEDIAFHMAIGAAAGNSALTDILTSIHSLLRVWVGRSLKAAGETRSSYQEHVLIFDAITAGDTRRAQAAMRAHMDKATRRLQRTLGSAPEGMQLNEEKQS